MLPELEQRDVPAPRMARDDGTLAIGEPAPDQVLEAGVHVLELRSADVANQSVPPLAAVAHRPAVVHETHHEAGVDVGLHLGLPAIEVEPRRPAMDEHQDGERAARVVGRHVEAVHALAVRVLEVP